MTTFTTKSQYKDNTMISDYKACPRKYFIRHVLGWTIDTGTKAPALVFGSCWHAGMDVVWELGNSAPLDTLVRGAMHNFMVTWEEEGYNPNMSMEELDALKARTPGIAHEMFHNYVHTREHILREANVLAIEKPVAIPFPNLTDFWYVGKLDKVIEWNGVHILEHKSTTAYAIQGNFQPDYVESWNSASQVKGYQVMGHVYYPNLQDVWVDASLVHKKVHDAFKFIPVNHSLPLLEEWIRDSTRWITGMLENEEEYKKEGNLQTGAFPRNEDSCFGKYSRCPFLSICATCSDPSQLREPPPGYKHERWEPFDTLGLDRIIQGTTEETTK